MTTASPLHGSEVAEILGGPGLSKADALLVDALIKIIQGEKGHLTSRELHEEMITRSRPADSPTHHLYEWDPVKAHGIYLLERSRRLVMAVRVIFVDMPAVAVRAYPVVITDGKKGPAPMQEVRDNSHLMAAVVEDAKRDLRMWHKRWEHLRAMSELSGVFEAVERITLVPSRQPTPPPTTKGGPKKPRPKKPRKPS